jgi:hypothetical protein
MSGTGCVIRVLFFIFKQFLRPFELFNVIDPECPDKDFVCKINNKANADKKTTAVIGINSYFLFS